MRELGLAVAGLLACLVWAIDSPLLADDPAGDLEALCSWISDEEALPSSELRRALAPGAQAPGELRESGEGSSEPTADRCEMAMRCLLEARGKEEALAAASEPPPEESAVAARSEWCCRLRNLLELSRRELEKLSAAAVAALDEGASHSGCAGLVQCLADSMPEAGGASKGTGREAGAGEGAAGDATAWRTEFDGLCSLVSCAASMTPDEIRELIARSDALLERLAALEIPQGKIFIFRLEKCRSFFEYALELTEMEAESATEPPSS